MNTGHMDVLFSQVVRPQQLEKWNQACSVQGKPIHNQLIAVMLLMESHPAPACNYGFSRETL